MIVGSQIHRYYLYSQITDMRKSINGLSGLVLNEMKLKLRSGDGFVFFNRRRNMVKILVWDRTGFVVYFKKLSQGTFEVLPVMDGSKSVSISSKRLMLIMEGVQLNSVKYRKRFEEKNGALMSYN